MENSLDEEGMHLQLWGWFPDSSAWGKAGSSGHNKMWRSIYQIYADTRCQSGIVQSFREN